jgi:hypothetical protein
MAFIARACALVASWWKTIISIRMLKLLGTKTVGSLIGYFYADYKALVALVSV